VPKTNSEVRAKLRVFDRQFGSPGKDTMRRKEKKRSRGQSHDHGGLIPPHEMFARPGEVMAIDPGPPPTPDEQFRERVATAWAWVKAVRFYEHEHERLRGVLVEMLEGERSSDAGTN